MTIFEMPVSPSFSSNRFSLMSHTRAFKSVFDNSVQTEELVGARWSASYTLPTMTRKQAVAWQVFGVSLRGMAGRFYGFDPDYAIVGAQGNPAGLPLINGADQVGTSLNTDGWIPSARIYEAGDQFAFDTANGRELKMIMQPVDSDVTGAAILVFEPPIRSGPADDAVVIIDRPSCLMMLDEDVFGWDSDHLMHYSINVTAVEVFS